MDEKEKNLEQQLQEETAEAEGLTEEALFEDEAFLSEDETVDGDFSVDDILKEFYDQEDADEILLKELESSPQREIPPEKRKKTKTESTSSDTIRITTPVKEKRDPDQEDTIRVGDTVRLAAEQMKAKADKNEPYGNKWQAEHRNPAAFAPPIVFQPRSRIRELKRKLVAGPERRYYEINQQGFGKLQIAMFLNMLVVILSACATAVYAMGMVSEHRMKLMVFCQFFAMMVSALLGSFQLLDGISDIFRGRFSLNSLLVFTFGACFVDGVFCFQSLRVPCCAAFSLQMAMSLWGTYHRRQTEMAMMDTMRKATRLNGLVEMPDYHDGCTGLLRKEGQVEDFMEEYSRPSGPEKALSVYAVAALLLSAGVGIAAAVLHKDVQFAVQVFSVSLLAAVPVTSFITLSRPMALLERRLHSVGAVLCGWRGVRAMSRRVLFPIAHDDLFPTGACKLNGVKFYGSRNTDLVVAYCTALIKEDGSGLAPVFEQLLNSRNGKRYQVENFRSYGKGGIGGEVCEEPVLVGSLRFLKEMGVEIPEGTTVNQALYAAIDGEFCGVFAVAYAKTKAAAMGLRTLCSYRGLRPVLVSGDFMLTEEFLRSRFSVNTRRISFPERAARAELAAKQADEDVPARALITSDGLLPYASAVAGARALRTASIIGVVLHVLGGLLGLGIMMTLAILGEGRLLTPSNLFLYELAWMIPGLLITEWTRSI